MPRPRIVGLVGPTAIGKTELSLELARRLDAEIVNCDSMQVYRRMAVLTQQPTPAQRAAVPHHLLDCVEPTEPFNVGQYRQAAQAAIDGIRRRGRIALIVGGTGLYLRALTDGLCEAPPADEAVRRRLQAAAELKGIPALHARLRRVDPIAAGKIHSNDARRLVRALEVYELTGTPLSSFWGWDRRRPSPITVIGLTRDRAQLDERINRRVERMIRDEDVLEEVRPLLDIPLSPTARQAHGLKYLASYLRGEQSLEEIVPLWQRQVRQYARRQLIWFRADPRIRWITIATGDSAQAVIERALDVLFGSRVSSLES